MCFLTETSTGGILGNQTNAKSAVPSVTAGSEALVGIDNNERSVTVTGTAFTVSSAASAKPHHPNVSDGKRTARLRPKEVL